MSLILLNLLLALGYMIVLESFTLKSLCIGFLLGYGALWLTRPLYREKRYFKRVFIIFRLVAYFVRELLVSNLRVLWDVVTPSHISRPGIIRFPLEARTAFEIMLVANLISLTPGTLSVDLSADRRYLYVHVMFLDDADKTCRELKTGLERRVLEVLR